MLRIAITGGMACGKSAVGRLFEGKGIPVKNADELAHEAMSRGHEVFGRVLEAFGPEIVGSDGEIDRERLGERVFADDAKREILNDLVHPAVVSAWLRWLAEQDAKGNSAAAVEIPLLFEVGLEKDWDLVVCVVADRSVQLGRLADRGLSREQAEMRLAAQWPLSKKAALSDYVIENSGERGVMERQVERVVSRILEK